MANGGESSGKEEEQYVLRSGVRAGLKREFLFAMKAQSEVSSCLGRTRSTNSVKKPKKSVLSVLATSPAEPMDLVFIPSTPSPVEVNVASSEMEPPVVADELTDSHTSLVKQQKKITIITYKRMPRPKSVPMENTDETTKLDSCLAAAHDDERIDKPVPPEEISALDAPVLVHKPLKRFTRSLLKEAIDVSRDDVACDDVADQVYTSGRRFTRSMVTKSNVDGSERMVTKSNVDGSERMVTESNVDGSERMVTESNVDGSERMVTESNVDGSERMVTESNVDGSERMVTKSNVEGSESENMGTEPGSIGKNLEIKMSKKIGISQVPTNLRELLGTGLLEGLPVKYNVPSGKLPVLDGVIKGIKILCYCTYCKGRKSVSPLKFESHAGSVKRRPSDFIYLENSTNLRTILTACRNALLNTLEVESMIQDLVGPMTHERRRKERSESPSFDHSPSKKASLVKAAKSFGQLTRKDHGLHKLVFMEGLEGTLVEYCNEIKGDKAKRVKLLGGYVKFPGIFCDCCHTVISPSQFEAHAGYASRRKPYHHIYTSNGYSLHAISVMMAEKRKISPKKHDDLCTICMDGGDVLLCDRCPRVYHLECLGMSSLPGGKYHCRNCKIIQQNDGAKINGEIDQIVKLCVRVASAQDFSLGGCALCKETDFNKAKFDDRTILLCDQCEKEYHVGCLREHDMADLKKLPKGEWFCSDACNRIHKKLQYMVLCGPEKIHTSDMDLIKKKRSEKGLNGEDELDVKWRLLSHKWTGDDCKLLFSRAVNIFHESFAPIEDAWTKKDLIPSMVYGRTFGDHDYSGVYCAVLTEGSSVVSVGLLRVMGGETAELPLVATKKENQGLGYFQALFSSIERLLKRLKVKHFVLPAADEAFSIWTSKFGFSPVTSDKLEKYLKGSRTTVFQGTSILHKLVRDCS